MHKPLRLASKKQTVVHNGRIFTVAEVESADYRHLQPGQRVFLARAHRGTGYWSEKDKAFLCPRHFGATKAVRVVRNDLPNDGPLTVATLPASEIKSEEMSLVKVNIGLILFPISSEPLPPL